MFRKPRFGSLSTDFLPVFLTDVLSLVFLILAKIDGYKFSEINYEATTTDIFLVFNPLLWAYLVLVSVIAIILYKYQHKISMSYFWASFLIWSVVKIFSVITYYPMGWKCAEEHGYFTKAFIQNIPSRNSGWPGAYSLMATYMEILGINNLIVLNIILAIINNTLLFLLLLLIDKALSGIRGILPILFGLAPVYEYLYFSDQALTFTLFILVYYILLKFEESRRLSVILVMLFTTIIISNPVTTYVLLLIFILNIIIILVAKAIIKFSVAELEIRNTMRFFMKYLPILFVLSVLHYLYNNWAMLVVLDPIKALTNFFIEVLLFAHREATGTVIRTIYRHSDLHYLILYYGRYLYFAMLLFIPMIALLSTPKTLSKLKFGKNSRSPIKHNRYFLVTVNAFITMAFAYIVDSIAMGGFIGTVRYIMFGVLFLSVIDELIINRIENFSRKLVGIVLVMFLLYLPVSYALNYFPSVMFKLNHPQLLFAPLFSLEFQGDTNLLVFSDTYTLNYFWYINPKGSYVELLSWIVVYANFSMIPDILSTIIHSHNSLVARTIIQSYQVFINYGRNDILHILDDKLNSMDFALVYNNGLVNMYYNN